MLRPTSISCRGILLLFLLVYGANLGAPLTGAESTGSASWITNGCAVFKSISQSATNPAAPGSLAKVFSHYRPDSLQNLIWTNFVARTNGRTTEIWSRRQHPQAWPSEAPQCAWNTNSLVWGMKGMTALSPCWEQEGSSGQIPITALTRRHGFTRGHGMGPEGFRTNFTGKRIWFLTTDNQLIQVRVLREVVRIWESGRQQSYTIVLFSEDLPASIEPIKVTTFDTFLSKYKRWPGAPTPLFQTEQWGHVSAGIPGFNVNTSKGGGLGFARHAATA